MSIKIRMRNISINVMALMIAAVSMSQSVVKAAAGIGAQKRPTQIDYVSGILNNSYSIVQTTIEKLPGASAQEGAEGVQGGKPVITRAQLDVLGPNRKSTKPLTVKLELPVPPVVIETHGATQVLDKVGKFVGAVGGPKGMVAGTAISGVAVLADYATHVAEKELNALYENQQFRISLLEIIPTRYYTIDTQTDQINPTALFYKEISEFEAQKERYLAALKAYQDMNARYTQSYTRVQALSSAGLSREQYQKTMAQSTELLNKTYENDVKPLLEAKNKEETRFSEMYSPYRIAIMASPAKPGNSCKPGSGPWELYVIYYEGAKQTNQIAVKYCVPNGKLSQNLIVELMSNDVRTIDAKNQQREFVPGGVRLAATQNATFAQSTGMQSGNYNATKTELFNWFTSMVSNPAGDGIGQFMVPFDLHELRTKIINDTTAANKAKMDGILTAMDGVIEQGREAKGSWDKMKQEQKEKAEADAQKQAREGGGNRGGDFGGSNEAAPDLSMPDVPEPDASAPDVLEPEPAAPGEQKQQASPAPRTGKPKPTKSKMPTLTEEQKAKGYIIGEAAVGVWTILNPEAAAKVDPRTKALWEQAKETYQVWQKTPKGK